jgi:type II secretory pathway pseudopilin PulG
MLVVAIISLLAAIAIPKFANMVVKAKEAAVKGKLGSFRSAISIYYADNEGLFPLNYMLVQTSLVPKYIEAIPSIKTPTTGHPEGNQTRNLVAGTVWDASSNLGGVWLYPGNFGSRGDLYVNCTHTDSTGTQWSLW